MKTLFFVTLLPKGQANYSEANPFERMFLGARLEAETDNRRALAADGSFDSEEACKSAFKNQGIWGSRCVHDQDDGGPVPTQAPTQAPTYAPTQAPTQAPTYAPTQAPTDVPTLVPTAAPTEYPTDAPEPVPDRSESGHKPTVLMGYFSNWLQWRKGEAEFDASMIQGDKITHLNYAFGMVGSSTYTEDGSLTYPAGDCSWFIRHFEDNDLPVNYGKHPKGQYYEVNVELKQRYPHVKTFISLGGWSFNSPAWEDPPESTKSAKRMKRLDSGWNVNVFSDMACSSENRKRFIESVFVFCRKWGFDGVDLDWEYPAASGRGGKREDKANFSTLLRELRTAIDNEPLQPGQEKLLLTIAAGVGPWTAPQAYDVPVLNETLDFINLMTYDLYGAWDVNNGAGIHSQLHVGEGSTEKLSGAWAVNWWLDQGAEANKLVLGAATYSRSFKLQNASPSQSCGSSVTAAGYEQEWSAMPGTATYYEMRKLIEEGAVSSFDAQRCGAYLQKGDLWMGYDDENTMQCKADFAIQNGLRGVFVWSLGEDDFTRGSPLMTKLSNALNLPDSGSRRQLQDAPMGLYSHNFWSPRLYSQYHGLSSPYYWSSSWVPDWEWKDGGFVCKCKSL